MLTLANLSPRPAGLAPAPLRRGSCSPVCGPPGQTPGVPSLFAAQRSPTPALPFPLQADPFPNGGQQGQVTGDRGRRDAGQRPHRVALPTTTPHTDTLAADPGDWTAPSQPREGRPLRGTAGRCLSFSIRLRDGWGKFRQEWTSLMGKNSMPRVVMNTCNLNIQSLRQGGDGYFFPASLY